MSKLLRAGFARLFKDRLFWICNAVIIAFGVYFAVKFYIRIITTTAFIPHAPTIDELIFEYMLYAGLVYAAFCALFIGREYSDGTIRNKLVIGHTRSSVYFSTLIVASVGNIIITLSHILPTTIICVISIGWFEKPTKFVVSMFIALIILSVAYAAVFTVLSLLISNKAVSAIVCVILAFALLMNGAATNNALYEPKFSQYISVEGELCDTDIPNPYYIGGFKRQIYKVAANLSPGGQSIQLALLYTDKPEQLPLWSMGLTVVVSALGVFLFSRKDIK